MNSNPPKMAPKDGPDIRTQRLVLRPVRESDDRGIFAMRSRLEIMKWRYTHPSHCSSNGLT